MSICNCLALRFFEASKNATPDSWPKSITTCIIYATLFWQLIDLLWSSALLRAVAECFRHVLAVEELSQPEAGGNEPQLWTEPFLDIYEDTSVLPLQGHHLAAAEQQQERTAFMSENVRPSTAAMRRMCLSQETNNCPDDDQVCAPFDLPLAINLP